MRTSQREFWNLYASMGWRLVDENIRQRGPSCRCPVVAIACRKGAYINDRDDLVRVQMKAGMAGRFADNVAIACDNTLVNLDGIHRHLRRLLLQRGGLTGQLAREEKELKISQNMKGMMNISNR